MNTVVSSIIEQIHAAGGRFLEQNWKKVWVELSEKERRIKVERYLRSEQRLLISVTDSDSFGRC